MIPEVSGSNLVVSKLLDKFEFPGLFFIFTTVLHIMTDDWIRTVDLLFISNHSANPSTTTII